MNIRVAIAVTFLGLIATSALALPTLPYSDELSAKAEAGDADSQFYLGKAFHVGANTEVNYAAAHKWYQKAAAQNHGTAIHNLGYMHEKGLGVDKDHSEALKYYRKGAAMGVALSQHSLGIYYDQGRAVKKDLKMAFKWFLTAAQNGSSRAQYDVGHMFYSGDGTSKNWKKAREYWIKSANQGSEKAKNSLAALKELEALDDPVKFCGACGGSGMVFETHVFRPTSYAFPSTCSTCKGSGKRK